MSKNINLAKTDISNLFKELESIAKESKLEEKNRKDYVEPSVSDISNLFENLEVASKEAKIEIEVKKSLSKEDQTKLNEFSGIMDSIETIVEEKSEEPPEEIPEEIVEIDPQKEEKKLQALQELFSTITHKEEDELREYVEETQPEEKKVEPTNIIEDIVFKLDDMGKTTEIQEEVDQISKLRREFENFQNVIQRRFETSNMSGAGSGEVRLEFLDDVQSSTAKVDGKFLKYSSSAGKFVGGDSAAAAAGDLTGSTLASGITASSLTSVGTLTTLTVDNVIINGTTIGHTDDTDLITLADGVVTVAGELSVTTLDIGGTNVTSTAAELNLVDGITAGTVSASKAVIADSNKDISGFRNLSITGDLTVSGTTTTVNQTVVNVTDAFVFEGANADAHETTFRVDEPTADRKASLQDKTGTIALLSGFKLDGTDSSKTNEGDFIVLNTSADDGDRLLFEDGTSDPIAVLASHGITLSGQGWNAFRFENP